MWCWAGLIFICYMKSSFEVTVMIPFWHLYSLVKRLKNNYRVNYKLYNDSLRQFSHPHLIFFFSIGCPQTLFKTGFFLHSLDKTSLLKYLSCVYQGGNGRAGIQVGQLWRGLSFCHSLLPFLEACPWIQFPCQHLGSKPFKDDLVTQQYLILMIFKVDSLLYPNMGQFWRKLSWRGTRPNWNTCC